ncbi:gamma-glutamyl-gamma-aminobutyrate hydrolase family protein [Streptomyces europaeiscabiei]|uniref:gamma-glutamyl-gamma-aminobutyrate hydrolase family protein n=1 Tax=Streptomyces europaeiscabiei TaxID=146819 RepID=UPI0029B5D59F|nr:gamma-glutamyl-gamma-aminobutyrate hydrolase family protein [Streptomyces europaeiscabiei]MDX3695481.1 gamma-glutamyl-gamma-aminobutyrate hydrolase family protein [Streptomyces europaeiscabiei]
MRPLVAIPARVATTTSALRYSAEVAAQALVEAVYRAGGEPFIMHPADKDRIGARMSRCDAVLLPGGGDLAPHRYGARTIHEAVYDVSEDLDTFDLAVARHALGAGMPLLAICRGLHVVNVALGGTLHQHMEPDHRHVVHPVVFRDEKVVVSCYHHQRIDELGTGLRVVAESEDGTIEAVELRGAEGWFLGVQWHPEDTAADDPANQALFEELIRAA